MIESAVKVEPKNAEAWEAMGDVAMLDNRCADAVIAYSSWTEVATDDAAAYFRLGIALSRVGESARAKDQVRILEKLQSPQVKPCCPVYVWRWQSANGRTESC